MNVFNKPAQCSSIICHRRLQFLSTNASHLIPACADAYITQRKQNVYIVTRTESLKVLVCQIRTTRIIQYTWQHHITGYY